MKKYIFTFNHEFKRMRIIFHACNFEQAVAEFKDKLKEEQINNIVNYNCTTKPIRIMGAL